MKFNQRQTFSWFMNQYNIIKNIAVRLFRVAIKFSKNDQNFVEVEKIPISLSTFLNNYGNFCTYIFNRLIKFNQFNWKILKLMKYWLNWKNSINQVKL